MKLLNSDGIIISNKYSYDVSVFERLQFLLIIFLFTVITYVLGPSTSFVRFLIEIALLIHSRVSL
jgi:hypothetical protein